MAKYVKKEKLLSRCVVGGINGKPVTVHIGDKIKRLFVQEGKTPYWDLFGTSEKVKIIKSEKDQYIITTKRENNDRLGGEMEFYSSNEDIKWYRLFHVVEKCKKPNKEKKRCNTP